MKKYTNLIWAFLVKKKIIYKMDRINILPILLLFLFPNPIFGQKKWVFETTFCDVIIQPKYNDCPVHIDSISVCITNHIKNDTIVYPAVSNDYSIKIKKDTMFVNIQFSPNTYYFRSSSGWTDYGVSSIHINNLKNNIIVEKNCDLRMFRLLF